MIGDTLGYEWRIDGNFLVRCICSHCGDGYDVHAMANWKPDRLCPACEAVREMEKGDKK